MQLGNIAFAAGANNQPDRVAESARELATLSQLSAGIDRDKEEQMKLQELEQQQYAQISEAASELLESDRDKVRMSTLSLQQSISRKIKEAGGRKAYMSGGGYAEILKYKTDVLTGPAMTRFKDNKKNMERILMLNEAGKGNLISDHDMKNLLAYQSGQGDEISYSGIKSEVELPEKYYNFGEELSPKQILAYGDNYVKIYGNMIKDHPDLKGLSGDSLKIHLEEYTWRHYRGKGMDKSKMEAEEAEKRWKRERELAKGSYDKEEKEKEESYLPYTTILNNALNSEPPTSINDVMDGNYIDKLREKNEDAAMIFGDKSTNTYNGSFKGLKEVSDGVFGFMNDAGKVMNSLFGQDVQYKPASAYRIMPADKEALNKKFFDGVNEKGGINFTLSGQDWYSPNGKKINEDMMAKTLPEKWFSNRPEEMGSGSVMDYIVAYTDENDNMITTLTDKEGKAITDKEAISDHKAGFSGKPKHNLFAVVKSDDGAVMYRRIDMNSVKGDVDVSLALGDSNNLHKVQKTQAAIDKDRDAQRVDAQKNRQSILQEVQKAGASKKAFGSDSFAIESRTYRSDKTDRTDLLKAFYLAAAAATKGVGSSKAIESSGLVTQKYFTKLMQMHPELEQAALDPSISDEDLLQKMALERAKGADGQPIKQDYEQNLYFTNMCLAYYKQLKQR